MKTAGNRAIEAAAKRLFMLSEQSGEGSIERVMYRSAATEVLAVATWQDDCDHAEGMRVFAEHQRA